MDEREFVALADAQLNLIESALDEGDLDFEVKPGGILELEFPDGSKIILNRHTAAREIWLAARSGGFHFKWTGTAWVGTRDARALLDVLAECISQQLGRDFAFE